MAVTCREDKLESSGTLASCAYQPAWPHQHYQFEGMLNTLPRGRYHLEGKATSLLRGYPDYFQFLKLFVLPSTASCFSYIPVCKPMAIVSIYRSKAGPPNAPRESYAPPMPCALSHLPGTMNPELHSPNGAHHR